MSITDELREFAPHLDLGKVALAGWKEGLLAIADRIDAEHEKDLRELNDYASASILLPKDADGEVIHIGDRMENIYLGYVLEVIAVGVDCFVAWNTHLNRYWQYDSKLFRHHHKPTLEDVLREFGEKYCDTVDGCAEESELFAEYAAKLQLKETA